MSLDSMSEEQAESILDRLARRVGHENVGVIWGNYLCLLDNLQAMPTTLFVKDGLETVPCMLQNLDKTSVDGLPRLSGLSILETILDISRSGFSIVFFAPPSQEQPNWKTVEFLQADMTLEKLLIALDLEEVT